MPKDQKVSKGRDLPDDPLDDLPETDSSVTSAADIEFSPQAGTWVSGGVRHPWTKAKSSVGSPATIQQQKPRGGSTIAPEPPAQEQDPDALVKGGNEEEVGEEEGKTAFQKAAAAIGAIGEGERRAYDPGGVAAPAAGGPALPPGPITSPASRIHAAQKRQAAADLKEKTRAFRASPGNQIAIRESLATYRSR
jgi:hypothetical protein